MFSLTFFPTALGQYSGDMVYVIGEGECDSSGHQTIFSLDPYVVPKKVTSGVCPLSQKCKF